MLPSVFPIVNRLVESDKLGYRIAKAFEAIYLIHGFESLADRGGKREEAQDDSQVPNCHVELRLLNGVGLVSDKVRPVS